MASALPPNVTPLEEALEAMALALDLPVDLAQLMSPERCPEELLPFLAWHLSADDWSTGWPLSTKREIVRRSVEVHRKRGTLGAVLAALEAAGFADADVYERGSALRYGTASYGDGSVYEPGAHWAEYRVRVPRPMTAEQAAEVRRVCERAAPLRCHLIELSYPQTDFVYAAGETYGAGRVYGGTAYA